MRNKTARNFGLYSRDMTKAALNAMRERGVSFNTQHTTVDRFRRFAAYLRQAHGIKDMRWIERAHLVAYAKRLADEVERGTLAQNTAVNYLSAANTVLAQARGDEKLSVSPGDTVGRRSHGVTRQRAPSPEVLAVAQKQLAARGELGGRVAALLDLARAFGHRFEEAALFDARAALRQVDAGAQQIAITRGTKGGRDRTVPVTHAGQVDALRHAAAVQGTGRSVMSADPNYAQFRTAAYHLLAATPLRGFHGLRHAYAQARYEALSGVKPPVVAGVSQGRAHTASIARILSVSVERARDVDRFARRTVAEELGHGRIAITRTYLG